MRKQFLSLYNEIQTRLQTATGVARVLLLAALALLAVLLFGTTAFAQNPGSIDFANGGTIQGAQQLSQGAATMTEWGKDWLIYVLVAVGIIGLAFALWLKFRKR